MTEETPIKSESLEAQCRELVESLEDEAEGIEHGADRNLSEAYENGVCAGIRYAKDELEAILDE